MDRLAKINSIYSEMTYLAGKLHLSKTCGLLLLILVELMETNQKLNKYFIMQEHKG